MKKTIIFLLVIVFLFQSSGNENQKQADPPKALAEKPVMTSNVKKITPIILNIKELPNDIKYEGKIKNAVKWTDNVGENIVITTETGIYKSSKFKHDNDGSDAEILPITLSYQMV